MTAYVDRHGQTGYMRGRREYLDGKRSRRAAESLRTYAETVYAFQKFFFERRIFRIRVRHIQFKSERALCHAGARLKIAAYANTDNYRRARVRTGVRHGFYDKILYSVYSG